MAGKRQPKDPLGRPMASSIDPPRRRLLTDLEINAIAHEARTKPLAEVGRHVFALIGHIAESEMTQEKMVEFIVNELIDDIDKLAEQLLKFEDRFAQYGRQFEHLLTAEKRAELEACLQRFNESLKHLAD